MLQSICRRVRGTVALVGQGVGEIGVRHGGLASEAAQHANRGSAGVDAHVIPGACAHVIPQVVGPW
jgi:hypothetical protein